MVRSSGLLAVLTAYAAIAAEPARTVFDFTVKDAEGKEHPLRQYGGKVLLIVNVASKCGFTSQYKGLQALHEAYAGRGLVVLGFPCNQFGGQGPGTNAEIQSFCSANYGVGFPVLGKVDVNGAQADPLYVHLKAGASGVLGSEAIKWNFTKFLVDRQGRVRDRYASATTPASLGKAIEALLAEPVPAPAAPESRAP